jgi:hypothetical protein
MGKNGKFWDICSASAGLAGLYSVVKEHPLLITVRAARRVHALRIIFRRNRAGQRISTKAFWQFGILYLKRAAQRDS